MSERARETKRGREERERRRERKRRERERREGNRIFIFLPHLVANFVP